MVLSDQMPVLVLPETTLFPASFLPAIITAPAQIKLMHDVINGNRFLIVAMAQIACQRSDSGTGGMSWYPENRSNRP